MMTRMSCAVLWAGVLAGMCAMNGGCLRLGTMKPGEMEWVQVDSQAPRAGNVYLIRGFIGLFSYGIDHLTDEINQNGIRAHVFQEDQYKKLGQTIVATYRKAPGHEPICLIGHSLGADDVIRIARELDKEHVPVDLLITIDATTPPKVPNNVKVCYNYYQPSIMDGTGILRGIPLETEPGFAGKLYNYNIRKERKDLMEWDTNHVNVDKNSRIHAEILTKLRETFPTRQEWVTMHQEPKLGEARPAAAKIETPATRPVVPMNSPMTHGAPANSDVQASSAAAPR